MEPCPKPKTNKALTEARTKWEQPIIQKEYDKPVRDRIPEIIAANGDTPIFDVLNDCDKKDYLKQKLKEEVDEFLKSESIEELADVCEVILSIVSAFGWAENDLKTAMTEKRKKRGGFQKGIRLLKTIEEKSI